MEVTHAMEKDYKRAKIRHFRNVVLILLAVLLLSVPVFGYFRIQTGSHLALREAKNIKLAFDMLSVEYYGSGKSIYNSRRPDGLADGVKERVLETTESKGDVRILEYDKNKRTLKAFVYETGHYRVNYTLDDTKAEHWDVDYLWSVQSYDGGK